MLDPTWNTLWISSFVFRKDSFFYGRIRNYTIITNRTKKIIKIVRTLIAIKFSCKNSLTRIFELSSNCNQNLKHLFYRVWRRNFNLFERFEHHYLCKHNSIEVVSVLCIKIYGMEELKNNFIYLETSDTNLLYQITFKTIDSPGILRSKIHPRYFTFA